MISPATKMFGTKYGTLPDLPTARDVRTVYGHVDIGDYRVRHYDNWGDERFPWQVLGPCDENGERDVIESFPQYREAVAFAKRCARILKVRREVRTSSENPVGKTIRKLPAQDPRIESGPVQFGNDWTGVFIRGDNAAHFAMVLGALLQAPNERLDPISLSVLHGLQTLLAGARA